MRIDEIKWNQPIIYSFWKGLKDEEHGGYYGEMDYSCAKHADKGILNSRILWFFSPLIY